MAESKTEKQKVQEITEKLEQGIKELFESEKYKTYLNTMSKFHNYSFNNTMLIAMQKPDATLVAGFKAWQKNFDRHVKKGEKGIRILAPAPYKIKEERDKIDPVTQELLLDKDGNPQKEEVEITIPAFRAVSVFDVAQTDGKPIPELAAKELLSDVEGYQDMIRAVEAISPVPIELEEIAGDSKGYYDREAKRIAVQENMSESQTLKTMIHEAAQQGSGAGRADEKRPQHQRGGSGEHCLYGMPAFWSGHFRLFLWIYCRMEQWQRYQGTESFHGYDTEDSFGVDYRDRGTITGITKEQGSITGTDKGKYSPHTEY